MVAKFNCARRFFSVKIFTLIPLSFIKKIGITLVCCLFIIIELNATFARTQSSFNQNEPVASDSIQYVIHVSVDGLRPDVITNLGPANLPNFFRLRMEGVFTDNARTDFDFTNTLPNHTDQLTSRPVSGSNGHNVNFNSDNGGTVATAHGSYIASVFDVVHDHSLKTGMYASKSKFILFERSWNDSNGAPDTIGTDDGRDKIDFYRNNSNTTTLIDGFLSDFAETRQNYSFIHLQDPDPTGHSFGWGSPSYNNAVIKMDRLLGRIFELIDQDPAAHNKIAIILTADHGGSGFSHSDASNSNNYTVPFYVWGPGIPAGADLYVLNLNSRKDPGTGRPDFQAMPQPIRNGAAANLALNLLGLESIPGSSINASQDLQTILPGGSQALPSVVITSPLNEDTFEAPATITITTSSSTSSGHITLVEFFANWLKIGETTISPFNFTWRNVPAGNYVLTARATDSNGIGATASVSIEVTAPTSVAESEPHQFVLFGNYPNPFQKSTNITFSLQQDSQVTIVLYDLLGRKIETLFQGWRASGQNVVRLQAPNLPAGVYFYRFRVGHKEKVRRLLIVR
ncbi:MAG: alkaline phosphatase family protein [bacterium]